MEDRRLTNDWHLLVVRSHHRVERQEYCLIASGFRCLWMLCGWPAKEQRERPGDSLTFGPRIWCKY